MELELPTQNVSSELQDQLRELLSYCETQAGDAEQTGDHGIADAYDDVAGKLRGILDGEQ